MYAQMSTTHSWDIQQRLRETSKVVEGRMCTAEDERPRKDGVRLGLSLWETYKHFGMVRNAEI